MFSLFSSYNPSYPRIVISITTKWLLTIVKTTNKFSSNITLVQAAFTLGLSDKVKHKVIGRVLSWTQYLISLLKRQI